MRARSGIREHVSLIDEPANEGSPPDRHLFLPVSAQINVAQLREQAAADRASEEGLPRRRAGTWGDVPWRTLVATVGTVAAALLLATVVYIASDVFILILVAGFFAIVINRPVRVLQDRTRMRHGAAIAIVVLVTVVVVLGLIALFVLPVRSQLIATISDLPGTVQDAARGQGPIGRLVTKLNLDTVVRDNQQSLTQAARSLERSLPSMLTTVLTGLLNVATVVVITCLMLTQSEALARTGVQLVPHRHRQRVVATARDAASAVSGYMIGNLLISGCAGVSAFVVLFALGVPNAAVLAMFVAFADLIPLVGATIGAIVAVLAAFLVSPTVGVIAVVFFVIYQQIENSVLQVMIMAKRVSVNPLVVILSILVGVELFGVIGALLSVPAAGALSVILATMWRSRPPSPDALLVVGSVPDGGDQP